jgi:hypothetical protein
VLKTFPHDSADTSKTGSNRKDGALYGFLAAVDVSRALSLVVLSVFKSHVPPADLLIRTAREACIAQLPLSKTTAP